MKLRFVLAVAVVLGAVGTSVDALAQDDTDEPLPPVADPPPPSAPAPAPQRNGAPPTPFVRRRTLPAPPPPPVPRPDQTDAERMRAYTAWQYQYGVWQYQYDLWQRQKMANTEPPQRWYGWQTLLIDAGALSLVIAGVIVAEDSRRTQEIGIGMVVGGVIGGLVVPPVVHMAHGKWENAGISAGFRLGGAAVVFGSAAGCSAERGKCDGWAILGFIGFLAYPIAVIVDAANATEDVPPDEVARTTITPWYDAQTRGGGLSMRGLF